ncbi:uncharacterized protein G2W53_012851 [Senna tora]|uniref:Uncharacterized protein n=1 Tax=Senna tora TaxID=362788 RepID=A0A834TXG4_9FABA|nr:uncharacterized protein G2W53_012851 [Senna tora]
MIMNNSEADSPGNVLFSWEKKGGVSKLSESDEELLGNYNLPPPPRSVEGSNYKNKISGSGQDLQIPLPPCAFQPPYYRTSSKKGLWMQEADDPFLAAYKQCTKSSKSKSSSGSKISPESCLNWSSLFLEGKPQEQKALVGPLEILLVFSEAGMLLKKPS